jgi:VWFA-related protein
VLALPATPAGVGHAQRPTFSAASDLVILYVTVTDRHGRYVTGLDREDFVVLEDGTPQQTTLFSREDTPVTIGLIIDDSASMFGLRDLVSAAGAAFVDASHHDDEVFALLFNEHVRTVLPSSAPFTSDAGILRDRLQQSIAARGRTALYDAIDHGLSYANRGTQPRKALVVVSDGADNASMFTAADVEQAAAEANTVLYGIALVDPADQDARPEMLRMLSRVSGGITFPARARQDLETAFVSIARDIRSSYTVAYVPAQRPPGRRRLHVDVRDASARGLHARTRTEYLGR